MSDRHEARVLLAVLDGRWGDLDALLGVRPVDPEALLAAARRCDVGPTVHAVLAAAGRSEVFGEAAARGLERMRAKARMDNLLLLARLETALDVLSAAGVETAVLKGADTLHRFYPSFDARSLDDVDLLVPRAGRDRAIAALEAAGWRGPQGAERTHWFRSSFELPMTSPGPVAVHFDLHWALGQKRRYRITAEEVLARAVPLAIGGREALRLDDHDAVAHLLVHHVQHYFDRRLKWVLEMGRMAQEPGFSWPRVRERLAVWDALGAAGLSLRHIRKLFPHLLPEEAYREIPAAPWRLLATLPLRASHPLDLFRGTRRRGVQLWIAAAALERPLDLPAYLRHRARRDASAEAD